MLADKKAKEKKVSSTWQSRVFFLRFFFLSPSLPSPLPRPLDPLFTKIHTPISSLQTPHS